MFPSLPFQLSFKTVCKASSKRRIPDVRDLHEVVDGGPDDGCEGCVGDVVHVLREGVQSDDHDGDGEGLGHGRLGPAGSIQGRS